MSNLIRTPSILFVCVHNACRSKMAEAIFAKLAPDSWIIASAGTNPSAQVDPKAVDTLNQNGLSMRSLKPRGFHELSNTQWDYVVGMGCGDKCPFVPTEKFAEWDIPDPEDGPTELYQTLYEDLTDRMQRLIEEIEKSTE